MEDAVGRALMRMVSGLKVAMIVTIYFSLCTIIILLILGDPP